VNYDFERKIWTNSVTKASIPTTEWSYGHGEPYPILNDIFAILLHTSYTVQGKFNDDPMATFTIRSSNFCSVLKQNGLSCSVGEGPQQGLGKTIQPRFPVAANFEIHISDLKGYMMYRISKDKELDLRRGPWENCLDSRT